jgi:hypothetical protein
MQDGISDIEASFGRNVCLEEPDSTGDSRESDFFSAAKVGVLATHAIGRWNRVVSRRLIATIVFLVVLVVFVIVVLRASDMPHLW